jgi:microcystin degradation protein MlrC
VKSVFLAGLYHETHTFVGETTGLENFECRFDDELFAAQGDGSPLGGFLDAADGFKWRVVPGIDFRAAPSGTVEAEVFIRYWGELEPRLESALRLGIDGIFLVLHGAMTTASHDDVEGELLGRIRSVPGVRELPLFGVYDLHANFTPAMAQHANGLVAYRENPHTDARAAAVRAAQLLQRSFVSGVVPRMAYRHPPVMWPPTGTSTRTEPMLGLEQRARDLESSHDTLWALNVNAGFSFADVPDTGVSFSAVTTEDRVAAHALDLLADQTVENRAAGNVLETPVESVLEGLQTDPNGPILLVEPSDNIGGGAPGDGTGLLRAFLSHGLHNAGVVLNDPAAVARLGALAPGQSVELALGGKGSPLDLGPVTLFVELVSTSNGRFRLEDPNSHLASMRGSEIGMGPCAVVRHGGIKLLLTSIKTPPFDLGQWRSQGIAPEELSFVGVKAAVAHRQAYDPIAVASFTVATPGPCSSNLKAFPFKRVRRPIYPLDELD